MSQYNPTLSDSSGTDHINNQNSALSAILTKHSGSSRPSYAVAGQEWLKNSVSPWELYQFDGTDDILIAKINPTTNAVLWSKYVGAAIASASTVVLSNIVADSAHVTGTTATSTFTMTSGQKITLIADAAWPLTYHATTNKINTGGKSVILAAGDKLYLEYDGTTVSGIIEYVSGVTNKIQPFDASVATNTLICTFGQTTLDSRSSTLGSGVSTTIPVPSELTLTVPDGATLGSISAVKSTIIGLLINNAGAWEAAVVNQSGGTDLSETGLISTTAITAAADSANVIYSDVARTNVPYRVVGKVESTQATAGTWATAPSLVQGAGGLAFSHLDGSQYIDVSGSRSLATNYYNEGPFTKKVNFSGYSTSTTSIAATVTTPGSAAVVILTQAAVALGNALSFDVPAGSYYAIAITSGTPTVFSWAEKG